MIQEQVFGELLGRLMKERQFSSSILAEKTGIPVDTIEGWMKVPSRRTASKPRDWQRIPLLAAALSLNRSETDELLRAAKQPGLEALPLAKLKNYVNQTTSDQSIYEMVDQWISQIEAAPRAEALEPGTSIDSVSDAPLRTATPSADRPETIAPNPGSQKLRAVTLIAPTIALLAVLGLFFAYTRSTTMVQPAQGMTSIEFGYDPDYYNGSLKMTVCIRSNYFRLISRELHPNPRLLVDNTYIVEQECFSKYPVTTLAVGDVEEVSVGTGDTNAITAMRVYRVTRTQNGIESQLLRDESVPAVSQ